MELLIFRALVAAHIAAGATGAVAFWVPVAGRKGGAAHRRWGRVFNRALLITGGLAICISLMTLADPFGTHAWLGGRFSAAFIRGMFGWMMLHNGILTLNLVWSGWSSVRNRAQRARGREWRSLTLQAAVMIAAVNCAIQGLLIHQVLMVGISVVGIATGLTNLWYLYKPYAAPEDFLKEHVKGLIGAGISLYTAFMTFGLVRLLPALALNPVIWAIPLFTGLGLILFHWRKLTRQRAARTGAGTISSRILADDSTPGTPAPGWVPAPTK